MNNCSYTWKHWNFLNKLRITNTFSFILVELISEAALDEFSYKKGSWKYGANLQDNTHTEVWFQ